MDEPTWTPNGDGSLRCKACGCESFRLDQGQSCNCRPDGRPASPGVSQLQGGAPVDFTVPHVEELPSVEGYELRNLEEYRELDAARKRLRKYEDAAAELARTVDLMGAGDSWQAQRDETRLKIEAIREARMACRDGMDASDKKRKNTSEASKNARIRAIVARAKQDDRLAMYLRGEISSLEERAN